MTIGAAGTAQASPQVREFAPAKVNLFLHVTGRRAGSYHELQSLFAFCNLGDEIIAETDNGLSLRILGDFADELQTVCVDASSNIVTRAAKLLSKYVNAPTNARIALVKNLPVAAGIGGGSADAAATLRALATLWQANISSEDLASLSLALGADVPACIWSRPAMVGGIGEQIQVIRSFPEIPALLVNPRVHLSTADVFAARAIAGAPHRAKIPVSDLNFHKAETLFEFLLTTGNDLEDAARELCPAISRVLKVMKNLPGVALARMSGSGATCFALYRDPEDAMEGARQIAAAVPEWWVRPTRIRSSEGAD